MNVSIPQEDNSVYVSAIPVWGQYIASPSVATVSGPDMPVNNCIQSMVVSVEPIKMTSVNPVQSPASPVHCSAIHLNSPVVPYSSNPMMETKYVSLPVAPAPGSIYSPASRTEYLGTGTANMSVKTSAPVMMTEPIMKILSLNDVSTNYHNIQPVSSGIFSQNYLPFPPPNTVHHHSVKVLLRHRSKDSREKDCQYGMVACLMALPIIVLIPSVSAVPLFIGVGIASALYSRNQGRLAAYENSYIYEIRREIAERCNVPSQLIELTRKGVILHDDMQLQQITCKRKFHICYRVLDTVAEGTTCDSTGLCPYPQSDVKLISLKH